MKTLLALFLLIATAAAAEPLSLPVDCSLGETCWVMNYVDADPGPQAQDYTCRPRSYQGHDGTDFAVRDAAVAVPVLAAAAGEVVGSRDGEPDGAWLADKAAVKGKECGNGVMLRHADGLTTQYCHLRKGSVAVKPGDTVARGQPLGRVGLSGESAFPHLHLTVRRDGKPLDPFTGLSPAAGCGKPGSALWSEPPPYQASALYAAGFADRVPAGDELKADARSRAVARDRPLVLWGALFGAEPGATLRLRLTAPDGRQLLDHAERLEKTQAWAMRAAGRPAPAGGWAPGTYRGEVVLERGTERQARTVDVAMP